jgi:hypothetical protein
MNSDQRMRWYAAVVVVRARIDNTWQDDNLIDHQVRLLQASDAEAAYARALDLGKAAEHSYKNRDGEMVSWEFVGLADLDLIQAAAIEDGLEVYRWRLHGRPQDAVVPKDKLAVFWLAANADRKVEDSLD